MSFIEDNKFAQLKQLSNRILLFNDLGDIWYKSLDNLKKEDILELIKLFESSQVAISTGIHLDGIQFDVQRYFNEMITGRKGDESNGEGVSFIKVPFKNGNNFTFMLCTFKLPTLSSRITPMMREYCEQY